MSEPKFKFSHIVAWLGAAIAAVVALTAFAFQNFELKSDAESRAAAIDHRLERIEDGQKELLKELRDFK